jgi:hypothetical protein
MANGQELSHTYDVFIYAGRDGSSVKARITWGDSSCVYIESRTLFDLLGEIRVAIVVNERS